MAYYQNNSYQASTVSSRSLLDNHVVFSANAVIPTNQAVSSSLKEIFDSFHTMVTGELKTFNLEDNDG